MSLPSLSPEQKALYTHAAALEAKKRVAAQALVASIEVGDQLALATWLERGDGLPYAEATRIARAMPPHRWRWLRRAVGLAP